MEIVPSIIDYLGKYEGGIFVSVGLMYKGKFYNSIFYYTQDKMIINAEEKMIEDMGFHIEKHKDYLDLLKSILEKCEPFEDIIDKLEEIKTHD